jgi:hypothetical protein
VNRRQRIVFDELTPSSLVLTCLRQSQPGLNILTRGTGVITGRQEINVLGATCAKRTRSSSVAREVSALSHVFGVHD